MLEASLVSFVLGCVGILVKRDPFGLIISFKLMLTSIILLGIDGNIRSTLSVVAFIIYCLGIGLIFSYMYALNKKKNAEDIECI